MSTTTIGEMLVNTTAMLMMSREYGGRSLDEAGKIARQVVAEFYGPPCHECVRSQEQWRNLSGRTPPIPLPPTFTPSTSTQPGYACSRCGWPKGEH